MDVLITLLLTAATGMVAVVVATGLFFSRDSMKVSGAAAVVSGVAGAMAVGSGIHWAVPVYAALLVLVGLLLVLAAAGGER